MPERFSTVTFTTGYALLLADSAALSHICLPLQYDFDEAIIFKAPGTDVRFSTDD